MVFKRMLCILFIMLLIPTASFAANWNGYWVQGWHDEISGYDIYNISPGTEQVTEQMVILYNPDRNEWMRLGQSIQSLGQSYDGKLPRAWVKEKAQVTPDTYIPYQEYYYDISNNRLTLGKQYQISPDEKWGIQYNDYYESGGSRTKSLLLKNLEQGRIVEWRKTGNSTSCYWLPDSTVLLSTYSQEEKQNVISIFRPETMKYEKVVSGSLWGYDATNNRILFVKNEPTRKTWVMDLTTRKEVQADYTDSFFSVPGDTPQMPFPPNNLNLQSLQVVSPERVIQYEHEIRIGKETISLPFVFERANKEFIPLRPLMEPLGIKIDISELGNYVREYQISYRENKFILSKDQFTNYKWQLFVTPEVLEKLGLPEYTVSPVIH